MLTFHYEARVPITGKLVKGNVEAESEQAAAEVIRKQGQVPISLSPAAKSKLGSSRGRVKTKDKVLFSRQLATLINAGLPLLQSLRQVATQTTNKALQSVANDIVSQVEGGKAFSAALATHPNVFDRVFISLVQAGEASGTMDATLERLANQQEKDADVIRKVRGAMTYPAIVMLVMVAVVLFMVIKVLPQVQNIYSGLNGVSMPFLTVWLLNISQFIIHFWWLMIVVLIGLVMAFVYWRRTDSGRAVLDKVKMRAWPVAPLFNKMYMGRLGRTAQSLVASGVPLLQVIEITGDAVNNVHIKKSLTQAAVKVKGGKSLSDAISGDPNFLELVPNMLAIGEKSGALEVMLGKVADYYEKEVDDQIKAISTIIEPVLMIVMGVIALIIVAAILLPIYGLVTKSGFTSGIGGGGGS